MLTLSFIISLAVTYRSLLSSVLQNVRPFPSSSMSILFLHGAGYFYLRESASAHVQRKQNSFPLFSCLRWLTLLSFVYLFGAVLVHQTNTPYHPIDRLIASAQKHHQEWLSQAKRSSDLGEAVNEYQRRYNQSPPPYVVIQLLISLPVPPAF